MAINLGSTAIADAKLGTTQVEKIYLGSEQIWSNGPAPDPEYGEVVLYGYSVTSTVIENVTGGTVTVRDEERLKQTFQQAIDMGMLPIDVTVTGDSDMSFDWVVTTSPGSFYIDGYQLSEALTLTPPDYPFEISFTLSSVGGTEIDTTTTSIRVLASATEFNQYTNSTSGGIMSNGIPVDAVKEFHIGKYITATPASFLGWANNLDSVSFATDSHLVTIGARFLFRCGKINQPIVVPSGVTSIGNEFLTAATRLNSAVTLPNTLTTIGNSFMQACSRFNQPITFPTGLTSIGTFFMNSCTSFNQPLSIPSGVASINNNFMNNCSAFNEPLTLPSGATSIDYNFMSNCTSFNKPLVIPSSVTSIGYEFMSYCSAFNQPLSIPSNVTNIEFDFMHYCSAFNQPLVIPSSVTSIGNEFLGSCTSFNSSLALPEQLSTIGMYFMRGCTAFNQDLELPSTLTSIGTYFMHNANNMTSTIDIGQIPAARFATSNQTLGTTKNTALMYTTGVTITGTNRAAFISRFPNRTSSPYRKLIDGGA